MSGALRIVIVCQTELIFKLTMVTAFPCQLNRTLRRSTQLPGMFCHRLILSLHMHTNTKCGTPVSENLYTVGAYRIHRSS